MRAAQLVAPGRLDVGEFPVPEPAPGQVLVRTIRASICGSDTHVVFDGFEPDELPGRPGYPGHEGVGEVVASLSAELRPGDLVLTVPVPAESGCFAEYQAIDERSVIKLPADGDPVRLLMAQQLGTTILAMRRFWSGRGAAAATLIGAGSAWASGRSWSRTWSRPGWRSPASSGRRSAWTRARPRWSRRRWT
jgi:L-iditol 2-dehydrogenase